MAAKCAAGAAGGADLGKASIDRGAERSRQNETGPLRSAVYSQWGAIYLARLTPGGQISQPAMADPASGSTFCGPQPERNPAQNLTPSCSPSTHQGLPPSPQIHLPHPSFTLRSQPRPARSRAPHRRRPRRIRARSQLTTAPLAAPPTKAHLRLPTSTSLAPPPPRVATAPLATPFLALPPWKPSSS